MLKIGQEVRTKEGLKNGVVYGGVTFRGSMEKFCGQKTKVKYLDGAYYDVIHLEIDNGVWAWSKEMLDVVEKEIEVADPTTPKEEPRGVGVKVEATIKPTEFVTQQPMKKVFDSRPKFKKGDRVVYIKDGKESLKFGRVKDRNRLLGSIGIVVDNTEVHILGDIRNRYSLRFEDADKQSENLQEGTWLFTEEELMNVYEKFTDGDFDVIINYPATICIHRDREKGRVFKGVSKVMINDVYDREKGIDIAKTKVLIKMLERKLKDLSK